MEITDDMVKRRLSRSHKTDLAYTAGIIDGEGCIGIYPRRNNKTGPRYFGLRVYVGNTNEWLIKWLWFNYGGSVLKRKVVDNCKEQWAWALADKKAYDFLKLIVPFLHIKRPHAELALKFHNNSFFGRRRTDEDKVLEEAQYILMRSYNKRGR